MKRGKGKKRPASKLKHAIDKIYEAFQEVQAAVEDAEHVAQTALNRDSPVVEIPDSQTALCANAIKAIGGSYGERSAAWMFSHGRLTLYVRESGHFWITFSSTYGGKIGSYRDLKTIEELQVLMRLLGFPEHGGSEESCN